MNKRVVIHQPNYLPYQGFFYKLLFCDVYIIMDGVLFPSKGTGNFIYGNRIRGINKVQWLSVPTLRDGNQAICDVKISHNEWKNGHKHILAIKMAYEKASYFKEYFEEIVAILSVDYTNLVTLNCELIRYFCTQLQIPIEFIAMSSLHTKGVSTELLISLSHSVGATTYVSGPSGKKYMNMKEFEKEGIDCNFPEFIHPRYSQVGKEDFIPNLSIIDLLMNCGPESREILLGKT